MSKLAFITAVWSAPLIGAGFFTVLFPRRAAEQVRAFPRNVWAGRILASIDLCFSAFLFLQMGLPWFEANRVFVYAAVPAAILLVSAFMDDLLSVRALGGLFLLLPLGILDGAFVHPSAARLVMVSFAYLLVILGVIFLWSPYRLRQWTERWINRTAPARFAGAALLASGAGMLALGLFVY